MTATERNNKRRAEFVARAAFRRCLEQALIDLTPDIFVPVDSKWVAFVA